MNKPKHPGAHIREDVLTALGVGVADAAKRLGVTRPTLSRVLNGRGGISPEMARRLELAGAGTAHFWVILQAEYDLALAMQKEPPKVRSLREPATA